MLQEALKVTETSFGSSKESKSKTNETTENSLFASLFQGALEAKESKLDQKSKGAAEASSHLASLKPKGVATAMATAAAPKNLKDDAMLSATVGTPATTTQELARVQASLLGARDLWQEVAQQKALQAITTSKSDLKSLLAQTIEEGHATSKKSLALDSLSGAEAPSKKASELLRLAKNAHLEPSKITVDSMERTKDSKTQVTASQTELNELLLGRKDRTLSLRVLERRGIQEQNQEAAKNALVQISNPQKTQTEAPNPSPLTLQSLLLESRGESKKPKDFKASKADEVRSKNQELESQKHNATQKAESTSKAKDLKGDETQSSRAERSKRGISHLSSHPSPQAVSEKQEAKTLEDKESAGGVRFFSEEKLASSAPGGALLGEAKGGMSALEKIENLQQRSASLQEALERASETKSGDATLGMQELKSDFVHRQALARETLRNFTASLKEEVQNYKPPVTKVSLELNPENLGGVELTITQRGSSFVVQVTSNTQAMQLFAANSAEFKQQLTDAGFHDVEVSFNDGSFQGGGQGSENQQGQQSAYNEQEKRNENGLSSYRSNALNGVGIEEIPEHMMEIKISRYA